MKILALDPATKCGWAHSIGLSGTWNLSILRDESSGMRLIRMRGKLDEIYKNCGIDLVFFEAARCAIPKMAGAVAVQAEIQGVIKVWCHDHGVQYRGMSSTEIKKFATGKGNANKEAMVAAAKKRWPTVSIIDDNQSDALWILEFGKTTLGVLSA